MKISNTFHENKVFIYKSFYLKKYHTHTNSRVKFLVVSLILEYTKIE